MIHRDLLKKIRHIQIYTSRMVNDVFAGEYHSTFKGQGIEFEEVREYQPGDEIRSIDWNVTARMGRPFIKKFVEERELTVMLILDASASGQFGSEVKLKSELAAELCAVIAFSAIKNNDKVGLIIFTDRVEKYVPPKKGKRHVLQVIQEALSFKPQYKGTNINSALEFLSLVNKRKSVSFLISDFLSSGYKRALQIANKRHDIIAIAIGDQRERILPDVGIIELEDAETGEMLSVDTSDEHSRKMFNQFYLKQIEERNKLFRQIGVDVIAIETGKPYLKPLLNFFKTREHLR
ncbi:MAG: DUF58 domain-containing protein [Candidatus Omnitrophota bacterium]|nr:MAG: DUF58 domain-containing protein [Candidatus Omnitrophota bacterium]